MAKAAAANEEASKANRGEDFFLYAPLANQHMFGRDDLAPGLPDAKPELVLHSAVELAETNYHSQYRQLDHETAIIPATRHFGSKRYQDNRAKAGLGCCLAALAQLRGLRARAWNEDTLDEALDVGNQLFQVDNPSRDSLEERGGDLRRLILAELNDSLTVNNTEYSYKLRGVAVWGRMTSGDPLVLDLRRGLDTFFKDSDTGILQIPGEYEVAIWYEGGKYYLFDPYPAMGNGRRVGLREGGKSYVMSFSRLGRLCDHFVGNLTAKQRRKPFSVSEVKVQEKKGLPEPVCNFKAVAPKRWIVCGRFHEGDARFPEEHRNKQATPASIAALAIAHVHDPANWSAHNVDAAVVTGDDLYGLTMAAQGNKDSGAEPPKPGGGGDDEVGGEDWTPQESPGVAAGDVVNKFRVSEYDCIETEVQDCAYNGQLNAKPGSGLASLKDGLAQMFREHTHAVVTARGDSVGVWKHDNHFYYFDPHGCDENGYRSDSPRAAACLVRIAGTPADLAEVILGNLAPGSDDSFNISPVVVSASRLSEEAGVPEINLQSEEFEWVKPGTAALLMGARGEHSASGKVADRAGVEDLSGRTLALSAAAAFTAAAAAVPPAQMHQDHMHQFLDAGTDYYLEHVKRTGRAELEVHDLQQDFELGANTFSISVGDPLTLPLKLPDAPAKLDEEVEEEEEKVYGEGEEEIEEEEDKIKDMKTAMMATMWRPDSLALMVGDYHTLGVWCSKGGQVVAFDPAPTLRGGLLTVQRIMKGDELRLKRLADMAVVGEGDDEDEAAEDEEAEEEEAEGEEKVSVPEVTDAVPPDAAPALHVYASPAEFIDRLVACGGLTTAQRLAPYKLYPVTIRNELTSSMKGKRPGTAQAKGDGDNDENEAEVVEETAPTLDAAAIGKYFTKVADGTAVVRGRIAQYEYYYMEPNRDNQDAAMAAMGIVVDHIEPHKFWKTSLVDALLKYGDRLYTVSLPRAQHRPHIHPTDLVTEFHVVNFDVKLDITPDVVSGDIKAGDQGEPLSVKRALKQFLEQNTHGILCAKEYCVGVWRGSDGKAACMWEPHAVSASGKGSPTGAAALVVFADAEQLAEVFLHNVEGLARSGHNGFTISAVKVSWEFAQLPAAPRPEGAKPDEGYEHKVLTAYVEIGKGRTILRGSRPKDLLKFWRDTVLQSSCGAVVGACMSQVRRPELWTKQTVDEVMKTSSTLFDTSVCALGYELRPGEDFLLPLQVVQRFVLGINYVRFRLETLYTGTLENSDSCQMSLRCALGLFFSYGTHCIIWSAPLAVAAWRERGSALCYLWEPHACGASGVRNNAEDGAACLLTFTSPKLLAHAYLQNIPAADRANYEFQLYNMSVTVQPIKPLGGVEPPLVNPPPGSAKGEPLLPATSKVDMHGRKRRADESLRKHRPGSQTCLDIPSGKDMLQDRKSISNKSQLITIEYCMGPSKGNQSLACTVMAVAMSRVEDVCRWTSSTVRQVMESGDQLYKDSYLHFRPGHTRHLKLEQILRKLYTPGNCVCRVVVYRARHGGDAAGEGAVYSQLNEFFREECTGVVVSGEYAAALFRTPRGYYLFEPVDRDCYGRLLQCRGRTHAGLSHFQTVQHLADHVATTIPRAPAAPAVVTMDETAPKEVQAVSETIFMLHGVIVTDLRRLNRNER